MKRPREPWREAPLPKPPSVFFFVCVTEHNGVRNEGILVTRASGRPKGSGKLYVIEHASWGSYSQNFRRLITPHMNTLIRDAFDCSSRKPMKRHFASGFPRALLSLGQEKSSGVEIGKRAARLIYEGTARSLFETLE